jgi:uncharacterized membrane protein
MADTIKELNVDGTTVVIGDLTEAQQRFIRIYEEAMEKKTAIENEIITLNAAMRTLSNDLVLSIRADRVAKETAEATPAPETTESVATDTAA